jgi:transketolase
MLNLKLKLNQNLFTKDVKLKASRDGFGEGIVEAATKNENIVALAADLANSVKLSDFIKKYPKRFIQTGIAEQNMCSMAFGLATNGKIPFVVSHAVFLTSRAWDQIKLSICSTNSNVKVIGSHAGFSNGPDGLSAEQLEDIALMRVLPNMVVINTIDYEQTKKATVEIAKHKGPVYLRFSKAETPEITTKETPFKIGRADVLVEGKDITIISCGPIIYDALVAAKNLKAKYKIEAEVISSPTVKPLDEETILKSVKKTNLVVTVEEHQIIGGLGGAIAELLSEKLPTKLLRIGINDSFGESGTYEELKDKYEISYHHIEEKILKLLKESKKEI